MDEPILFERQGRVALIVLNRPKVYNAFNHEAVKLLYQGLIQLRSDRDVGSVVVSARGAHFCAGGDLAWAFGHESGPDAALYQLAGMYHQAVLEMMRMPKPVIAAIRGIAAGGGFSLGLACDFRIMETSAILRQAYTSNGLCIDGGGTFILPRVVGLARAMEIAAFDEPIPAEQALSWGLVTEVVDEGKAAERAVELARELMKKSLNSFRWSKKLLADSFNTPIETHLERERAGISSCAAHEDGREGMRAFLEKRPPVFGRSPS
ncbi:MAG: enoyl-CoA hydratase/isomerase family protein [Proteobacteria bacterium]|nr:enoyl-CoA hydratase/isomerase family protein [Pseudomonadota bacterium]